MASNKQLASRIQPKLGASYPALMEAIMKSTDDPAWWESLRNDDTLGVVLGRSGIEQLIDDKKLRADLENSLDHLKKKLAGRSQRPSPRLRQFDTWNAAFELRQHRTKSEGEIAVLQELSQLVSDNSTLDATLESPSLLDKLKTHYVFSTCQFRPFPRVLPHRLENILNILRSLELDKYEIHLVRNILLALKPNDSFPIEKDISRQAKWKKIQGLRDRLLKLEYEYPAEIGALIQAIEARNPYAKQEAELDEYWGPVVDTRDPLIGFAMNPTQGEFPNVLDVLLLGIWLYSGRVPGGNFPTGFIASDLPHFHRHQLIPALDLQRLHEASDMIGKVRAKDPSDHE